MKVATREMFATRRIASSRNVDDARHILSEVFLPVDFPLARASNDVDLRLNALKVGRLKCGYMQFRNPMRLATAEARNYHIDIPTSGRATMRAGLGPLIHGTQQTAGVFMPGRPVVIDSGEDFAQVSVMIPRDQLQRELENLLDRELARPLEFTGDVDLTTPGARTMLKVLRMVDDASGDEGGVLAHPLATQRLEQVLLDSLLFAQPHNYAEELTAPRPAAGHRPISQAAELLRSNPERPWTVGELASAVSVSVRSLQEGFRRSLDASPMTYLQQVRLEMVHEELAAAAPGTQTVTEVAARWGFLHLGRFAAAYRAQFSERPSETLRSPAGHLV